MCISGPDYYSQTYIINFLLYISSTQYGSNLIHSSFYPDVAHSIFPVLIDGLALTLSPQSETCDSSLTLSSLHSLWKNNKDLSVMSLTYVFGPCFLSISIVSPLIISHLKFRNRLQLVPQTLALTLYKSIFHTDVLVNFLKGISAHGNNM